MNINSEKKSQRKPSKPLLERRRRARINACLGELRTLLLRSHVTQGCHSSKLEKADILELTVRHLRSLQHRPSGEGGLFSVGYRLCVCEVKCFLRAESRTPHRSDAEGLLLQGGRATATTLTGSQAHTSDLQHTAPSPSQHHHPQHQDQHSHLSALNKPPTEAKASSGPSSLSAVWRPW